MAIKFRAIHTTRPWRKAQHTSIYKATDGPDGAKNLLRRVGRVGQKWNDYGPVSCVFVWDESVDPGLAFRLRPGSSYDIEMAEVPLPDLERHELAKWCSDSEVQGYFSLSGPLTPIDESDGPGTIVGSALPDTDAEPETTFLFPDELPSDGTYPEGLAQSVVVNFYERSNAARTACINHYKPICQVCSTNFEQRYGEVGRGYIHVHHLVLISSVGSQYQIDPIRDLVPVCPNCHAMLHRRDPPLSIAELRAKLNG